MTASVQTRPLEVISLSFADDSCSCPHCSSLCRRHSLGSRWLIDIHLSRTVLIHVLVAVFICHSCQKSFRQEIPFAFPRFHYTKRSIHKALASTVFDGLSLPKAKARLNRDFGINPSQSSIARWDARFQLQSFQDDLLSYETYHDRVISQFSGILVLDEVYDKQFAVVFARDPINKTTLGYLLTSKGVTQDKLRPFLDSLKKEGIIPEVVVTDDSALYPSLLKELWSECRHQLCLFHFTQDVVKHVAEAARAIENSLPKPEKRKRGRPRKDDATAQQDRQRRKLKSKARKRRRLLLRNFERTRHYIALLEAKKKKRATRAAEKAKENLEKEEKALAELIVAVPGFAVLRDFMTDYYHLFRPMDNSKEQAISARDRMSQTQRYQEVPQLKLLLDKLNDAETFDKLTVFLEYENAERTSNDAERTNRNRKRRQEHQHYRYRSEAANRRSIEYATVLQSLPKARKVLKQRKMAAEPKTDLPVAA